MGWLDMAYKSKLSKEEETRLARENVAKSFARVNADVFSIFDKDSMPSFLALLARFHYFDIYNLILIFKQRPDATYLAPYKSWERMSINYWHDPARLVFASQQDRKGLGILAPYILKRKIPNALNLRSAAPSSRPVPYLDYHIVYLLDKKQMNGIPVPVCSWDVTHNQFDAEAAYHAFRETAPFYVSCSHENNFKGNFVFQEGTESGKEEDYLVVNGKYRLDHVALCTFIVRPYVVQSLKKMKTKYTPDEIEKLAECVSFVVSTYLGLPTEDYSFFFVRMWASGPQRMLEILNAIRQTAHRLIDELEVSMIEYKAQFGPVEDAFILDEDIQEFENLTMFDI